MNIYMLESNLIGLGWLLLGRLGSRVGYHQTGLYGIEERLTRIAWPF